MADEILDIYIDHEFADELETLANAPDDAATLFERAGLGVREVLELVEDPLARSLRLAPLEAAVRPDARHARRREWFFMRDELHRGASNLQSTADHLARLVDLAIVTVPLDELDRTLENLAGMARRERDMWLGLAWLRAARLAGAPKAQTNYWATTFDEAFAKLDALVSRVTAFRTATQPDADRIVRVDARQVSPEATERLVDELRAVAPANDVTIAEPREMRGYGVFFGQSLTLHVPTLGSTGVSVKIIDIVRRWAQAQHNTDPRRPVYVTVQGRSGEVLFKLSIAADATPK